MKDLTPQFIADVTGGKLVCPAELLDKEVTSVTTDSRSVREGSLFIALKGEVFDGHAFIPQTAEKGALIALTESDEAAGTMPHVTVKSTYDAMGDLAHAWLNKLDVPVVSVTGSVGKTSTKETIATVLAAKYKTHKTEGNFNNNIGLPMTIFNIDPETEIAVLEMGINHFGEMHKLSSIANPDIAVITNIGTCHLEFLIDRDGVFRAKTEVFEHLKEGGRVVLNGDDDKLINVKEVRGQKPVFFGLGAHNDFRAENIRSLGLKGSAFTVVTPDSSFEVKLPVPGEHMILNALAACAVGRLSGLTDEEITAGLAVVKTISGRFNIIETDKYTLIDDCYNANPMSMRAALKLLSETKEEPARRHVAVLGDMAELGADEKELHRELGEFIKSYPVDLLLTGGPLAESIAEGAKGGVPEIRSFPKADELVAAVGDLIEDGDVVLIKAWHCMGFERIVRLLKEKA